LRGGVKADFLVWKQRYSTPEQDKVGDIIVDKNGNIYTVGYITSPYPSHKEDIVVLKHDIYGNIKWVYTKEGGGYYDYHTDMGITGCLWGDTVLYTLGFISTSRNTDWHIAKIRTSTGECINEIVYDHPSTAEGMDIPWDICVDENGDIYVTGMVAMYPGLYNMGVIKFDGYTGEIIWEKYLGFSNHPAHKESGRIVKLDHSGYLYAVGDVWTDRTQGDVIIIKCDKETGNIIWNKVIDYHGRHDYVRLDTTTFYEKMEMMEMDETQNVIYLAITTQTGYPVGQADIMIVKLDMNTGAILNSAFYGNPQIDEVPFDISLTPDHHYLWVGVREQDYVILKYDAATLNLVDEKRYDRGTDALEAMEIDENGNIYLTGESKIGLYSDIWTLKLNPDGNILYQSVIDGSAHLNDLGIKVRTYKDIFYVAGCLSPSTYNDIVIIQYAPYILTDDPYSLAYNNNRHLVRKEGSEELHLVFTKSNKIFYTHSFDGGKNWDTLSYIGEGKLPAIALSSNNLPSICWTDEIGGLWYRRQTSPGVWSPIYHLYDPWVYWQPRLTSPPSITITPDNIAHVLVNLYTPANSVMNAIAEIYFPISNPMSWSMKIVENATNILPSKVEFPSITKDYLNNLHALWQHGDTIYYAYREIGGEWNVMGWQFQEKGINSLHPFIEAYGDSIFAVWENNAEKEVYKGGRYIFSWPPNFEYWRNFSRTPFPRSITPVNASGKYVIYADELVYPPPNELFEIGWKTFPEDEFHNVSETPFVKSIFPHASLRKTSLYDYLYIVWQEGEYPPYEIRFKKIRALPTEYAYLSSISGQEIPSPYLIQRDTFFSNWQIPVDVGYNTLKYEFPIIPGYRYKIKLIAYHEGNGEWRARLKVDNKMTRLIKYNAFKPETITFWVPPAFYNDGKVELLFERIKGNYVTLGPIYVYRFEYEEYVASGIQDFSSEIINSEISFKNIFKDKIELNLPINEKTNIYIYDVNGRLLKKIEPHNLFSLSKYKFPKGTYFMRIENLENGKSIYKKIIKME
jgi:hypothetical protein